MRNPVRHPALTVAGVAVAGAATLAAAPSADAARLPEQRVGQSCQGLSPNLSDLLYSGELRVEQDTANPGTATVRWGAMSIWGYRSDGTLSWKNLSTGTSGSVRAVNQAGPDNNGFWADLKTGAGKVRFTTRAVNRGPFLTLDAPTCSGVATIR